MSCFLGSHPTPEKKHWWFIIFLFLVVLLWAPLYLVRRLSLTLLATKNGSVFKPWCFFPSLWSCRRASGAIKYYSKGQLPPPFPFKKSRVVCLELLHRQKTYKALVSIVLMCGTLKKIHTKGVGRAGASREQNCGAPFPPSLQTYEGFLLILLRRRQWRLEGALNIFNGVDSGSPLIFFSSCSCEMQLVYCSIPQSPAHLQGRREMLPYRVSFFLLCCQGTKKHLVLVSARSHTTWRRSFPQSLVHRETGVVSHS